MLAGAGLEASGGRDNTYAGWPAMRGLGRYYELAVACRGEADAVTGYFINIKHIDQAVRDHALPLMVEALREDRERGGAGTAMGTLLRRMCEALQPVLDGTVRSVRLALTPMYSLAIEANSMDRVTVRHRYEFSAAHRLHVPSFSEAENRSYFGKCNNPAGHGHNYHLEVAVSVPVDDRGHLPPVEALDELVDRVVIDRLDHKHLNVDVPAFADVNPSVENISRVIYDWLAPETASLCGDQEAGSAGGAAARLEAVSVWETEKTVSTYRGA